MGFGGRPKSVTKFVYRGGFKIPRELTPMPSVDSFGGSSAVESPSLARTGLRLRHRARPRLLPSKRGPQEAWVAQRRRTRCNRICPRVEGIIKSTRMVVRVVGGGSSAVEGGAGEGTVGQGRGAGSIGRTRPRTAGATVGRRNFSPSTLDTNGLAVDTRPYSREDVVQRAEEERTLAWFYLMARLTTVMAGRRCLSA